MEVGPGEIKNVAVLQSDADLHVDLLYYAELRNIIIIIIIIYSG